MFGSKQSKALAGVVAACVVISGLLAATDVYASTKAQKQSFAASLLGNRGFQWDFNADSTVDFHNFSTFIKGSVLVLDGFVLPAAETGETSDSHVGPGHGTWKYNSTKNKVNYEAFHADQSGSGRFYYVKGVFTPSSDGSPSSGPVSIKAFDTPGTPPVFEVQGITTSVEVVDYL